MSESNARKQKKKIAAILEAEIFTIQTELDNLPNLLSEGLDKKRLKNYRKKI